MLELVALGSEKPEAPIRWGGIAVAASPGVSGTALTLTRMAQALGRRPALPIG